MRYALDLTTNEFVIVKKQLGKISYLVETMGRVDKILTLRNLRFIGA